MRTRLRFLARIAITCAIMVAWSARVHQDVAAQAPKPIKVTPGKARVIQRYVTLIDPIYLNRRPGL